MPAFPACALPVALALVFASPRALAAPNMEEGNWEIATKMQMQGMPFDMPPVTHTQCLTRKDAVPDTSHGKQDCKTSGQAITADTVTWKVACTDRDGAMEGEGRITYAGRRFDGVMQIRATSKRGEGATMKYQFQGRYLGACDKAPKAKKADDY